MVIDRDNNGLVERAPPVPIAETTPTRQGDIVASRHPNENRLIDMRSLTVKDTNDCLGQLPLDGGGHRNGLHAPLLGAP